MTDATEAIRAILDEQEAAWDAGDAVAFSRAVTADVVFTNVVGMFSVGRAGFEGMHRHIFATFYKGSTLQQRIEQITFVRPDVAIVNTLTQVSGFGELPPPLRVHDGALQSRLEQVMVREDAGWAVAAFHNVIVDPQAVRLAEELVCARGAPGAVFEGTMDAELNSA